MQKKFNNEAEFVTWIRRQSAAPNRARGVTLGIGDDAALVSLTAGTKMILTTDMSIDGVHFKSGVHPPASIGHRALARSLSDIAAMGGVPCYTMLSAALSKSQSQAWLMEVYQRLMKLARRFGVVIVGGDTAVTPGPTTLDVIVTGEVPRDRALLRSGAKPGDLIYVSGRLGLSALGLRLLLSGAEGRTPEQKSALRAHLYPEAQCSLGQVISKQRLATAMMDLSDGLSIDLRRLCDASHSGATLFAEKIPRPAIPDQADALQLALHGGEDYQLLFTVSPRKAAKIPRRFGKIPLTCVGKIVARKGVTLTGSDGKTSPLEPLGWDHFARRPRP